MLTSPNSAAASSAHPDARNAFAQPSPVILAADELERLIQALVDDDYRVFGPLERDGAIVIDSLAHAAD